MSPNYRPTRVRVPASKVCRRCGVEQGAEAFSRNAGKGDGLNAWCAACYRDYRTAERAERRVPQPRAQA